MKYMKCDFSATTQEERVLDSMVKWYPRKTHFVTWDRCSWRIGILMKMLVIELKPVGWSGVKLLVSCGTCYISHQEVGFYNWRIGEGEQGVNGSQSKLNNHTLQKKPVSRFGFSLRICSKYVLESFQNVWKPPDWHWYLLHIPPPSKWHQSSRS
jgi:hypothetical protein